MPKKIKVNYGDASYLKGIKVKKEITKDKQLNSFIKYCEKYPEQRMFQALRNWIQINIDPKWNWLLVSDGTETEDTFHWSVENQSKPLTNLNG